MGQHLLPAVHWKPEPWKNVPWSVVSQQVLSVSLLAHWTSPPQLRPPAAGCHSQQVAVTAAEAVPFVPSSARPAQASRIPVSQMTRHRVRLPVGRELSSQRLSMCSSSPKASVEASGIVTAPLRKQGDAEPAAETGQVSRLSQWARKGLHAGRAIPCRTWEGVTAAGLSRRRDPGLCAATSQWLCLFVPRASYNVIIKRRQRYSCIASWPY
jgi:hypothetical protein